MLDGVVPFPPDFAARYRAKGYWQDKPLRDEFDAVFKKFGPRICIIDRERQITYTDLDTLSTNLALNLLELGFKPLDRVVLTLHSNRCSGDAPL
jgi:2,3-dihydroxybenzoate-AMP ligase